MNRFLIGNEALCSNNRRQIHDEFLKEFGIDLDSPIYANGDLADKWSLLLQECTVSQYKESFPEFIQLFKEQLLDVIDIRRLRGDIRPIGMPEDVAASFPDLNGNFIRTKEREAELREQRLNEFKMIIGEYKALLDNYYMYETDVWLNAYFVVCSLEAKGKRWEAESKNHSRTMSSRKPITGFIDTATGYVKNKNGREYSLPFDKGVDGHFCGEYLKRVLNNTAAIFWTEKNKEEKDFFKVTKGEGIIGFKGYEYRTSILLCRNKDYSRYGYWRIKKLEEHDSFRLEDKILFHKTINGILLRNMVNSMIDSKKSFEVEDYIYLIDQICGCKSLVWQNLIGVLFILFSAYQDELKVVDVYNDIYVMFYAWISNISKINYTLHLLTEGFLYLYQNNECSKDILEKKCNVHLKNLQLENGRNIEEYWENQQDYMCVTKDIEQNHRDYSWIYAILQREVINKTKYLYRRNRFQEKPLRFGAILTDGDKAAEVKDVTVKMVDFQPDIQNAVNMIKEQKKK